ncbi:hypothetical protein GA0070609_4203 [Micromonospora echinaurantiaca]|uniref:Flagellar basal body-associated protein FliL n=1 Tax=Micromonospora echinaurantiaca TaxID=47857 RepID=A0A1C5J8W4_9ACTN|nr:DUF3824 domain-containing protein [Micromonospora echinaurantiaca]SCG67005.1 hypothetical protein GA0070609_4203 [Micromonospora echinaurantiaca]
MSQPPASPYGDHGSYPPPSGGYPTPQQPGGYPAPQQGGYPSQQPGGYPHQQSGGYPSQQSGGYPQQSGGYPPQGGYPPAQPGQPYAPAGPPPKKKSGAGKIVLIVLAVVLVLCLGGAAVTWFAVKDDVGDAVDAAKTRVVAPATLAGRPQLTDTELASLSEQMVSEMKSTVQNETSAVGAFYGDPAKQDLVMVAAASGLIADPKKELDDAVNGLSAELAVSNMADVDPGPLGGDARCGDGKTDAVELGVCVWADKGSVGMIVIFFSSADKAKAEFVGMRGQIEQRS